MNTLAPISFGCVRNVAVETTALMQPRSYPVDSEGARMRPEVSERWGISGSIRAIAGEQRGGRSVIRRKAAASSETSFLKGTAGQPKKRRRSV